MIVDYERAAPSFPLALEKEMPLKIIANYIGDTGPGKAPKAPSANYTARVQGSKVPSWLGFTRNAEKEIAFFFSQSELCQL